MSEDAADASQTLRIIVRAAKYGLQTTYPPFMSLGEVSATAKRRKGRKEMAEQEDDQQENDQQGEDASEGVPITAEEDDIDGAGI